MFKLLFILNFIILGFAQVTDDAIETSTEEKTDITILDLSNHNITSLSEYDFSKYPKLEELNLSNNNIKHIKEDVFSHNSKLKKLDLSGNKNLDFPRWSTFLIADIEEINLADCNIKRLSPNMFDGLTYLKIIDLSKNPLVKKGIPLYGISVLKNPEKLIVPYEDKHVIKEICQKVNITIEIKTEDETESLVCSELDVNSWILSSEDYEDEDEEEEDEPEEIITDKNHLTTNGHEIEDSNEVVSTTPLLESTSTEQTNGDADVATTTDIIADNGGETPPVIEIAPSIIPHSQILSMTQNIPDDVYNIQVITTDEDRKETTTTLPLTPAIVHLIPRFLAGGDQNTLPVTDKSTQPQIVVSAQNENTTNVSVQEKSFLNDTESAKISQSTEVATSSTGTTILIILIVGVVVSGLAAFGYKFYKSRKYEATQTTEPVERELKEIVVDKKIVSHINEEEPLMQKRLNGNGSAGNETNENPKAINNEMRANSIDNGPYRPTTTAIKPSDRRSSDSSK